jgi:pimeloyl-ACP methyl ester carboxylesterase
MRRRNMEGQIYSQVTGIGDPTFVFVHGFGCGIHDWDKQVQALSASSRCLTLDLPWHGKSTSDGSVEMETLGAAVNQAIDAHEVRDSILVGHSLGARVIREAYVQRKSGISGMVLVDGTMYEGDKDELIRHAKESISRGGFGALSDRLFEDMFTRRVDPTIRDFITSRAKLLDSAVAEALMLDMISWDVANGEESLRAIEVPTMAIQSTYFNSKMQRVALELGMTSPFLEIVKRCAPSSLIEVIPDSGHFSMIESASVVNDLLRRFARFVVDSRPI